MEILYKKEKEEADLLLEQQRLVRAALLNFLTVVPVLTGTYPSHLVVRSLLLAYAVQQLLS